MVVMGVRVASPCVLAQLKKNIIAAYTAETYLDTYYVRSLEYNEKALAIKLPSLGPDHPSVATTYSNMALVYGKQGDYARSLEYNEKALAIELPSLGLDHKYVLALQAECVRLRELVR